MESNKDAKFLEVLKKLGMTKNDALVYLALLKLGKAHAGEIIKEANVHSSRVHESINKLSTLGLLTYTIQAKRKSYQAEDPKTLINIAKELEKETYDIIPILNEQWFKKEGETTIKVYEGYKGLKTLFDSILEELQPGEEHLVFSAVKEPEHFVVYFHHWNKERIKKGIKMRIAFNEEAKEQILETTKKQLIT